jgi:hypothetical protein
MEPNALTKQAALQGDLTPWSEGGNGENGIKKPGHKGEKTVLHTYSWSKGSKPEAAWLV